MRIQLLIIAIFLFTSCKENCDCYDDKPTDEITNESDSVWMRREIKLDSLKKTLMLLSYDPLIGLQSVGPQYELIYYLSKDKRLIAINLESGVKKYDVSIKSLLPANGVYSLFLRHDTLHILNINRNVYSRYHFLHDTMAMLVDSINMTNYKEFKNCAINLIPGRPALIYRQPYVWIQYAHLKRKNFIDSKAYLRLDLRTKTLDKVIAYPACYHCSYQYLATSTLAISEKGNAFCLFDYYDQIYKLHQDSSKGRASKLLHKCEMKGYQKGKSNNLAYTRKFLQNEETNWGIVVMPGQNIVALKRNKKNSLQERSFYSMFLFNESLEQIHSEKIMEYIGESPFFLNYKNGFLLINDSVTQSFFYEFLP